MEDGRKKNSELTRYSRLVKCNDFNFGSCFHGLQFISSVTLVLCLLPASAGSQANLREAELVSCSDKLNQWLSAAVEQQSSVTSDNPDIQAPRRNPQTFRRDLNFL